MMRNLNTVLEANEPVRIVLVDDSPHDLELMERELRDFGSPMETMLVRGKRELLAALEGLPPDLVITDYVLPDADGLEIVALVRERHPHVPVIVITGAVDERTASACIRAGAADYVLKDHLPRLPIAVMNALEKARNRSEILRAQAALRRSEGLFRMVAESAGDGILVADARGRIEMFNEAALAMFGYEEEEILGQEVQHLMAPEFHDRHRAAVAMATRRPEGAPDPRPREHEGVRRDGSRFPMELTISSWTGEEGTHLSGIIRDITDRKARDARLEASEEGYRLLVDHLPVATFTLALEPGPHLTFVSQRVEELLGFSTEQWLDDGSFLWSRIHPRDRRGVLKAVRRARTSGALEELTFRILGSGDRVLWVRVHASAVLLGTGEPVFQGILRDMTDLKGAELERDLLSAAVEQSESLVLITDLEGRTLYANRAFETITGYTREEVMGRDPRVLLGGVERKEADRKMWESLRAGDTQKQEFENRKKDGSAFFTRASISPVHDGRGRVTHVVGISHDITAEREMETQLRQMQKMETVGQLTGGIAHDMNNILSAVMSYTALARIELEPGQTAIAEDLGEVEAAARRGSELIRKLMAFSRREHLRYRVLDAEKVVLGLEGMLSRLLPANLRIGMGTEGTGAWCRADEGALEQILINLATNARDAVTGPGELHILVDRLSVRSIPRDASHRPAPGPFVRIRVRDTGAGMSEEVRGRVFEPFFTTKPVGKGTGMGMAVIHGLVGQHGGFLTVESAPGEGTTVSVHLPEAPEGSLGLSMEDGTMALNEEPGTREERIA